MSAWAQLVVQRFACGHLKTPENSYRSGPDTRCRECHRIFCREWYRANAGKGLYTWKLLR